MTTTHDEQCCQYIWNPNGRGTVRCSRKGTHLVQDGPKVVCTQHARSYDRPLPKAAK